MADKTTFSCGDSLDIQQVSSLYKRLQKSVEKAINIELKADLVAKADTAGLQMFVSLRQELKALGGDIIWKKPSDELLQAAKLLGLTVSLGLPVAAE
ncbi:STAS domain-containing protein [Halioxenophilus aromaticivorans]|uniref:STAS domain-containing protein n=1 Tax=Halioxenophilus aromaticivorans TaxID=1306992 RepID=A0AAV3U216_9ALTE